MVALLMKLAPIGLMAYFCQSDGNLRPGAAQELCAGTADLLSCRHRVFLCVSGAVRVSGSRYLGRKELLQEYPDAGHHCIGARSSAAALPLQLDACDKLGVPREVSSVVVPVGATCHMDGACIATIYEIALCCALFGHPLENIGDFAFALLIAVAGSVAVSSVPGGGAAMETMVISAFGFPSVALPVLLMMTQLFDAGCTLINSCGDTVASMLVTRVLYGKDWYKKSLNQREEREQAEI